MAIVTDKQQEYINEHPEYAPYAERFDWLAPFGETTYGRPIFQVPVELVFANPWNPNIEQPRTFDLLVENIEEVGFTQNIQVALWDRVIEEVLAQFPTFKPPEAGEFIIIGGEHRLDAVGYHEMKFIPAVILPEMDTIDYAQFQTVRHNILAGELDPERFTKMVNRLMKARGYSKQMLTDMMGFADQGQFERIYREVKRKLPKPIQDKLEEMGDQISSVEDLSAVIHDLMANYGDDLAKYSFMVFVLSKKPLLLVRATNALMKQLKRFEAHVRKEDVSMADEFEKMIKGYLAGD